MFMETQGFLEALLAMDRILASQRLHEALLQQGRMQALEGLVVPAMERIGNSWEQGQLALAQVYMAGRICEEAVEAILPQPLQIQDGPPQIGLAVFEDQHQLGKRIVASVIKSAGYRVRDYGHGLGAEELAAKALEDRVPVLMVSVLMFHSALHLNHLKRLLLQAPNPPVLIAGGAPFRFDPALGRQVEVDEVGISATDALRFARMYLGDA